MVHAAKDQEKEDEAPCTWLTGRRLQGAFPCEQRLRQHIMLQVVMKAAAAAAAAGSPRCRQSHSSHSNRCRMQSRADVQHAQCMAAQPVGQDLPQCIPEAPTVHTSTGQRPVQAWLTLARWAHSSSMNDCMKVAALEQYDGLRRHTGTEYHSVHGSTWQCTVQDWMTPASQQQH